MVEAYVWAVFFLEFEGFEFVLEYEFAEAHVVFFADAAYVVDVFGDYEGYVDFCVVEDLHDFLYFSVIAEDVDWALFESLFYQCDE